MRTHRGPADGADPEADQPSSAQAQNLIHGEAHITLVPRNQEVLNAVMAAEDGSARAKRHDKAPVVPAPAPQVPPLPKTR